MVAFDICDFSTSGGPNQMLHKRYTMYQVIQEAAAAADLNWNSSYHEDRGDGLFLLAPPDYSVHSLVISLAPEISQRLSRINKALPPEHQLRLRMAVHDGDLAHDDHGVVSLDLNLLFRLVNAPALRARFERGDFALIMSDNVYKRVIAWDRGRIDRKRFKPLMVDLSKPFQQEPELAEKEPGKEDKVCVAWASLPPQPGPRLTDQSEPQDDSSVRAQLEQMLERMHNLLRDGDLS